ncbi:hypothetical protein, partial [Tropicimonas sp. IMCC34043]
VAICAGLAAGLYEDWDDALAQTAGPLRVYDPGPRSDRLNASYARYQDAAATLAQLQARISIR